MSVNVSPQTIPAVRIIESKRNGKALSDTEIHSLIEGIASGSVPDYQATAFLMATFLRGMTPDETVSLTRAMLQSGERYTWKSVKPPTVDKHSTGGVGDKVSLILAPLVAACGAAVPMMSGRGLGHTGGTVDKLESIPGFQMRMPHAECERIMRDTGLVMMSQSETIAPADRKLYALRDVTATVECIPLIVASILSKKLAEGTGALVLDVKVGSGAFMKTKDSARKLAQALIRVAKKMGLPCRAVLTDMSQPLGYTAGNALEVKECIEILQGLKPSVEGSSQDLKEVTLVLAAQMLALSRVTATVAAGRKLAQERLSDGSAWRKFQDMVKAQGGDPSFVASPDSVKLAPVCRTWTTKRRGFVTRMDTEAIGKIIVDLGGGRHRAQDPVDPGVGLIFHKRLGDKVVPGDALATVYARSEGGLADLEARYQAAVEILRARKPLPKLVLDTIPN